MNSFSGKIALVLFSFLLSVFSYAGEATITAGKQVAFDRKKGNCLACHMIDDGELAGLSGPPLIMMKQRFPNAEVLRLQIWDATQSNPKTRMPPFGRNGVLSTQEIDAIVEYLYTL
jgi:sulfur-oxidizing protein SoxX